MSYVVDLIVKAKKNGYYEPIEKLSNVKTENAIALLIDKYSKKEKKNFFEEVDKDFNYVAGEIDKWLTKI